MRVAIVSGNNRSSGKTALSILLSNIYPNASDKESIYITNGAIDEILNLEQFSSKEVLVEKSINVLTEIIRTSSISSNDIYNFAYCPLYTNGMVFDVYSKSINYSEATDNMLAVVKKFGSRFIVMDLNGYALSPEVKGITDSCDVILYVITPVKKEIDEFLDYFSKLTDDEKLKVRVVCNMFSDNGAKKKDVKKALGIYNKSILWFPYHYNIQRVMFEGRLCVLNRLILEGADNCLGFRQPLKDILSYICDSSSVKVIKEVSKWHV